MELNIVSFEQAKELKELGFPQNIYTSKVYLEKTIPHDIIAKECDLSDWQCIGGRLIPCSSDYNKYGVDTCICPTLELCAKWLREEKNIYITILPTYNNRRYLKSFICELDYKNNVGAFVTHTLNKNKGSYLYDDFNSYEEALSTCIDKAIEILKNNEKNT